MTDAAGEVRFLGHRWADAEPLEPVDRDWAAHYAAHASFPVPDSPPARDGEGVLVVDASDFAAVRTAFAYRGDWTLVAFLPDVFSIRGDYVVRMRREAMIYGGLRDLELQAVCLGKEIRSLFVLDTPGRELAVPELSLVARSLWELREEWMERIPESRWPPRCRTTGFHSPDPGSVSPAGRWERSPGGPRELPPEAAAARTEARLVRDGAPEALFQRGDVWISVGQLRPLSDFTVVRTYFHSFRLMTEPPPSAWPEPGLDSDEPRRRFLSRYLIAAHASDGGVQGFLRDLARRASPEEVEVPDDLPGYVLAWLGRSAPESG